VGCPAAPRRLDTGFPLLDLRLRCRVKNQYRTYVLPRMADPSGPPTVLPGRTLHGGDTMTATKEQISPRTGEEDAGFSLSECTAVAVLPATDIERARRFYAEKLGLIPTPGAAPGHYLYQSGGATFVLYETPARASGTHDQMGFSVSDLETVVRRLKARGVVFTGDIAEDERTRTAWFKDSEGNLLMAREILACPAPNGGHPVH
jgi:predicted enzyme related to lactoylglutathione lyase